MLLSVSPEGLRAASACLKPSKTRQSYECTYSVVARQHFRMRVLMAQPALPDPANPSVPPPPGTEGGSTGPRGANEPDLNSDRNPARNDRAEREL